MPVDPTSVPLPESISIMDSGSTFSQSNAFKYFSVGNISMAGMANIPVFDGTNYREWIDELDSFFQLTGLWYIATGTDAPVEPKKSENPTHRHYTIKQNKE